MQNKLSHQKQNKRITKLNVFGLKKRQEKIKVFLLWGISFFFFFVLILSFSTTTVFAKNDPTRSEHVTNIAQQNTPTNTISPTLSDTNSVDSSVLKPEDWVSKNAILISAIVLCLLFLTSSGYTLYVLTRNTKKYDFVLDQEHKHKKNRNERSILQEQLLTQFEYSLDVMPIEKDTVDILRQACKILGKGLGSHHVMIFCHNEIKESVECKAAYPKSLLTQENYQEPKPLNIKWPQPHVEEILSKQFLKKHYNLSGYTYYSVINIEYKTDLHALLFIENPQKTSEFPPEDNLFISAVTNILILYFELKQKHVLERQLFKQYYFDAFSQLPNKKSLVYQLNEVIASFKAGGIMLLEVANLTSINNAYGVQIGDDLLRQLSERLQKITGTHNFTARTAQNRFTILSYDHDEQEISNYLRSLFEEIKEPFILGGQKVPVPLNAGVAFFPRNTNTSDQLIEYAAQALQVASIKKPGSIFLYDNINISNLNRKQELTIALHKALELNELEVYYQPFLGIENFKLVGAEALMRWNSQQFGQLSPDDYISLAEETGIIIEMGLWVLESACKQAKIWQEAHDEEFTIAVNVSPRQLLDPNFSDNVLAIIEKHQIRPETLELEITEMIASQEDSIIDKNVNTLVGHKIGFAIDDFGSGYASFHYIKRFASKKIKIDRKFTENIENSQQDANLVKVIVAMGHALEAKVTAEGVSNLEQFGALKDIGCDYVQGFFIAQPMPVEQFDQFLIKYFPK